MNKDDNEITVGDLLHYLQRHSPDLKVRLVSSDPGTVSGGFVALDVALQHIRQEQAANIG